MLAVCWGCAVSSSFQCFLVVNVRPCLAVDGIGCAAFTARVEWKKRLPGEDAVQAQACVVQYICDGLQLLFRSKAFLADGAESFGPWMRRMLPMAIAHAETGHACR